MKKNLIYTVAFLLCGSFLFGSCQDMLNVDSDRVEYELDGWTPADSVYSVLGILKAVQGVGDRQILLNELRADLVTVSNTKAVAEVQEIYNSNFSNLATNEYFDVKDYYTIINNCNIFLNRVDTTLYKNGKYYMMREYVAVKSIRAWAYLQLAINHNEIPFFTEPVIRHSVAEEVMQRPKLSRDEVLSKLIADIQLYENPLDYPMPVWSNNNSDVLGVPTAKLFVPIRMLLGEMYLWKGDYKNAAKYFYGQITGASTVQTTTTVYNGTQYFDNVHSVVRSSENSKGTTNINNKYSVLFYEEKTSMLTTVPFATNEKNGTVSGLSNIFAPVGDVGGAQVYASPGIVSLAAMQMYCNDIGSSGPEYGNIYDYQGDLRIKATTYSEIADDQANTKYSNIIAKFNLSKEFILTRDLETFYAPNSVVKSLTLQRAELAYLRFAEALVGLADKGYVGAMEVAMETLKEGLNKVDTILLNPVYKDSIRMAADTIVLTPQRDEAGEIMFDEDGKKIMIPVVDTYLAEYADMMVFNFALTGFEDNIGIHSRGSGDSEKNVYYALDPFCIARYLGKTEINEEEKEVVAADVVIEYQDSVNYVRDLVIDELALEMAWEGFRFGDLVRFAEAMDDPDVLAKRVAGREKENKVTYRNQEFEMDDVLYNKMLNKNNWYIPLPDTVNE